MENKIVKKEEFRWSFLKKGKQVLNICTRMLLLYGFTSSLLMATEARANPTGGTVVTGSATITNTSPNTVTINQSTQNAVINWKSFDIANGETTRVNQPGATSTEIEQIFTSGQLTAINGNLFSNGRIVVSNPNGVIIGKTGNVNTAGFIATASKLGDTIDPNKTITSLNFNQAGNANASVVNEGNITVADTGLVALVAPSVRNDGVIQGNLSTIQLGAADTFGVDFYGDGLISLAVGSNSGNRTITAENNGSIIAPGGKVLMTAAAASDVVNNVINNTGVVEANAMDDINGQIVLKAPGATTNVSGTLQAQGGSVETSGDVVNVADGANIQAASWLIDPLSIQIGGSSSTSGVISTSTLDGELNSGGTVTVQTNTTAGSGQDNNGNIVIADTITKSSGNSSTLNLDATGSISFSGGNGITDTSSHKLNVNMTASNGSISIGKSISTNGGDVTVQGASGITDAASITTGGGDIEFKNAAILGADDAITTAGGDVAFDSTVNGAHALTVSNGSGTVTFGAAVGATTPLNSLAVEGSGTTTLDGNVTTSGSTAFSGPVALGGNDTITAVNVTFSSTVDSTSNTHNTLAISSAGTVAFDGAVGGKHTLGSLQVNGGVITLGGNISTNNGLVTLNGPVTLTAGDTISAGSGNVTFGNAIDGNDSLTVSGGTVLFEGALGQGTALSSLSVTANNSVTLDDDAKVNGNAGIALTASATGGTGNVQTAALTSADGDIAITTNNGTISTGAITTTDGSISLTTTSGHGGDISTGNLSITSADGNLSNDASGNAITVSSSGGSLDLGSVSVVDGGTTGSTNASISLTSSDGAVTTNALTATSTDGNTSSVTVSSSGDLKVNGAVSASNIDGGDPALHSAATVSLSSAQGNITTVGAVSTSSTDDDQPNIGATSSLSVAAANGSVTIGGNVTASSTQDKTQTGGDNNTATTTLSVTAKNDITVSGNVSGEAQAISTTNSATPSASSSVTVSSTAGDLWLGGNGTPSSVATNTLNTTTNTATQSDVYNGTAYNQTTSANNNTAKLILSGIHNLYTLNITADSASKTYGQAVTFAGTEFTTSGLQSLGSVSSVTLNSTGASATANVNGSPYSIVPSNASGTYLYNYNIVYKDGSLTVNPATLTVTPDAVSTIYDGTVLNNANYSGNTGNYSITGYQNGQNATTAGVTLSGSMAFNGSTSTSVANAGSYTQDVGTLALGSSNNNYKMNFVNTAVNDYVIQQEAITVSIADVSKTYDGTTNVVGTPQLEVTSGQLYANGALSGGTFAYADANAGTGNKTVFVTGPVTAVDNNGSNNYAITLANNTTSTIKQAGLTVDLVGPVDKTYDGTTTATLTGTNYGLIGVVASDAGKVTLNDPTTGAYDTANAGTGKTVTVNGLALSGTDAGNYTLNGVTSVSSAVGTIDAEHITVSTSNVIKTYDGTDSTAGATTAPALVVTSGKLYTNQSNGGAQDTLIGGAFAYTDPNAGIGNKTVTVSGVTANDGNSGNNYSISYADNTSSTINQAQLLVTADSKSMSYGSATLPVLTETITGYVNSENATSAGVTGSATLSTTATAYNGTAHSGSDAGTYTITAAPGTLNAANYTFTYQNGTLHVTPVTLVITANNDSKTYNGVAYSGGNGVKATGLVNGDTLADLTGTVTYSGSSQGAVNTGSYAINPSGLSSTNYNIGYDVGTLNIAQAPLTITADSFSKPFGTTLNFKGTEFTTTGTLYGSDSVTGVTLSSLGAPAPAAVGNYAVNILGETGSGLGNYNITTVAGNLNVRPAALGPTITFDPLGRPIISVGDDVVNYYPYFEPRQTQTLDVNVSLRGNGQGGNQGGNGQGNLANLEPAAGGDDNSPGDLANIEPAAGGNDGASATPAKGSFSCANNFLDGKNCTAQ